MQGPYTDRHLQAGGGFDPQDAATLSRDVASAYASLSSQFGEKFHRSAARYEHNDDLGGELIGARPALRVHAGVVLRGYLQ